MSKRAAERELTQDNVDDYDDAVHDTDQTWKAASQNKIKQRVYAHTHRTEPHHTACSLSLLH